MKFKVRFHKIRRFRAAHTSAHINRTCAPRCIFRRAPLALAMSAAIAMLSSGALAVTPGIDQDNADIVIAANETGDVVTVGGPWQNAAVAVSNGATLSGDAEAISATDC